jgi:hypothetical protein
LRAGFERRRAGALMLWFVAVAIVCVVVVDVDMRGTSELGADACDGSHVALHD